MDKIGLNFGQLIAYLVPGFLAMYAVEDHVPAISALLGDVGVPTAEALIPLLLFALAIGVVVNAVSWALLRPLFSLSGVPRPESLDYTALQKEDLNLYNDIVESNFRYHQFYSNMLAAVFLFLPTWVNLPLHSAPLQNVAFLLVVVVLFAAARDALKRAYTRMLVLMEKEASEMTNGNPIDEKAKKPVQRERPISERAGQGPEERTLDKDSKKRDGTA